MELFLLNLLSSVTGNELQDGPINKLIRYTSETAQNTSFDFLKDGVSLIALISLALSFLTIVTLYFEFRNDRLAAACQKLVFKDLIRHLYRNKICTLAMRVKYYDCKKKNNDFIGYPSEEHYRKLQLMPEDLHLESYNRNAKLYHKFHELDLLLRNYNTEIEVAEGHIKSPNIDDETKQRDFATLDFKTGYLTVRIYEVLVQLLTKEDVKETIKGIIQNSHISNMEKFGNQELWGMQYEDDVKAVLAKSEKGDSYFEKFFDTDESAKEFRQWLTKDLLTECGLNKKQEEKIHIINLEK